MNVHKVSVTPGLRPNPCYPPTSFMRRSLIQMTLFVDVSVFRDWHLD